jgi:hypothetical protein
MKILALSAENIKRLSAVEIKPDGSSLVVIAGENEAGKSSVLDAIEMALGGEKKLPAEPLRRGADKGRVVLDLGDIVVTRRFTKTGTSLTVTNRDGAKYPSPQALIDGLVGRLTFDPLAFASMKDADQATTLRALAHINTSDLEADRKAAYDERTLVNRDVTQATATLATLPAKHADVGETVETFEALTAELEQADQLAQAAADAARAEATAEAARDAAGQRAAVALALVEELREKLAAAETASEEAEMAVSTSADTLAAAMRARARADERVPDRVALRTKIADIERRNQCVRENQQRAKLEAQQTERQADADRLTARIDALDAEKAKRLTSASFPLPGLGLDDTGVTWQGLPFAQASTAVRTRVSVAIGLALNPKLRVSAGQKRQRPRPEEPQLIAELAAAAGAQVWLERIDGGERLSDRRHRRRHGPRTGARMNTKELVFIDLSSIAYPIWHMSQSESDPNAASQKIVARVRALAADHASCRDLLRQRPLVPEGHLR